MTRAEGVSKVCLARVGVVVRSWENAASSNGEAE